MPQINTKNAPFKDQKQYCEKKKASGISYNQGSGKIHSIRGKYPVKQSHKAPSRRCQQNEDITFRSRHIKATALQIC